MAQWPWYDLHGIKIALENHGWTPVVRWAFATAPTWIVILLGTRYLKRWRRELLERTRRSLYEDAAAAFYEMAMEIREWGEDDRVTFVDARNKMKSALRAARSAFGRAELLGDGELSRYMEQAFQLLGNMQEAESLLLMSHSVHELLSQREQLLQEFPEKRKTLATKFANTVGDLR